jgi:hypothetical protein
MTTQIQNPIRFGQKFMSTGESIRQYTITGIDDGYSIVYLKSEPGDLRSKVDRKHLEQMFQKKVMVTINS